MIAKKTISKRKKAAGIQPPKPKPKSRAKRLREAMQAMSDEEFAAIPDAFATEFDDQGKPLKNGFEGLHYDEIEKRPTLTREMVTPEMRRCVDAVASTGTTLTDQRRILNRTFKVNCPTDSQFSLFFEEEIQTAKAFRIHNVAQIVYQRALRNCVASSFFVLKCQGGWREKDGFNEDTKERLTKDELKQKVINKFRTMAENVK